MPAVLVAAQYKAVDSKSMVTFTIKNFGITMGGSFRGVEGSITFNPNTPDAASFTVSIAAGTVNTGNDVRDNHLKGEDYFDASHYPRISFESTKVTNTAANGVYTVYGRLTIKNHAQAISFPFTAMPSGDGYLFTGSFTINRRDFGVGGFSTISNNAEINLSLFGGK